MTLIRYTSTLDPGGAIGVVNGDRVHACVPALGDLLAMSLAEIEAQVFAATSSPGHALRDVRVLPPLDADTEVWGAGVTYKRSRDARVLESASADVYSLVYEAARPELFFKSTGRRVVTDGDPIFVRRDSVLSVPEPELVLVLNSAAEIVGYLVGNDVTSRCIEGEYPLYLPQAKTYTGSCALSAAIVPAWSIAAADGLEISCSIRRGDVVAWSATTSTAKMHRSFEDLVSALFAELDFPRGAMLFTGAGIVPDMDITLEPGDVVAIDIDGVGRLTNPVARRASAGAQGQS
jgi:2-dehydro-3-deoxy-D-arabinonate dehydratase